MLVLQWQILTACNLASFSLSDSVLSLLGRPLEILPSSVLSQLALLTAPANDLTFEGKLSLCFVGRLVSRLCVISQSFPGDH